MRKRLPAQTRRGVPIPEWHSMRLALTGLLFFVLRLPVAGQDTKPLHLILHNQPVKEALHQIEKQAGVTFHFDKTRVDMNKAVTLDLDKATLPEALDALGKVTGYQFRQRGDKILIVGAGEVLPLMEDEPVTLIKGRVTDATDQAVQGVSCVVKGTNVGTQTDASGLFQIKAPRGSVLIAS